MSRTPRVVKGVAACIPCLLHVAIRLPPSDKVNRDDGTHEEVDQAEDMAGREESRLPAYYDL